PARNKHANIMCSPDYFISSEGSRHPRDETDHRYLSYRLCNSRATWAGHVRCEEQMTVTGNFRLLAQSETGQIPLGRISRRAIRPPIPLDSRIHRAREVPFRLNRNT